MQTSVLWKLNYIFIVVFLFLLCGNYWSCLSSNILVYKDIHLPHSTFPLISSAYTLMRVERKGKGERDNFILIYCPVHWVNFCAEPRSRTCAESSDEDKNCSQSGEEEWHRIQHGQFHTKRSETIINGPACVFEAQRERSLAKVVNVQSILLPLFARLVFGIWAALAREKE